MTLQIPPTVQTYEMENSIIWLDEQGILYSKPKSETPVDLTREQTVAEVKKLLRITGGKKVCMILESPVNSKPPKKEDRDFLADQLNSVAKAMAILTDSPLSRMIANLFFTFKPPQYPIRMFSDESEAQDWIKKYL